MGTKIQANPYLREYHCLVDLDANTSNAMNGKWMQENGRNSVSLSSYDVEKVRQTIIAHESTFRNQLRELHRLHGRQQELMNEIKRRGMNKDDVMEGKSQLSYLFSPFPTENAKRPWNSCHSSSPHSVSGCPLSGASSKPIFSQILDKRSSLSSYDPRVSGSRDDKFSLSAVQTSQHNADALAFSLYNRSNYTDRFMLAKAEMCSNLASNLNLVTKDLFRDSLDRTNKEGHLCMLGLRNEMSGKDHSSHDYAERGRINKHSSVGDLFSGKSFAFPQSLQAEPRKEFLESPSDVSTSLSRKKKKIFGVDISEGNDDAFGFASNMSINLDRNHTVPTLESSSLVADTRARNLNLHTAADWNDGNNERSKADSKGDISSQEKLPCNSGTNGKWLEGDLMTYFKNVDNANNTAEVLKKDPEHSQELPWFLRNSPVSADLNNAKKSSYFMNLDSLQNCSQKFFKKAEIQKREVELEINKDRKNGQDSVQVGNNGSDLRHCIDLNLSLDEQDASSAPSLPSAIVKIATTEIELEAPAVIDSEVDADASKPYQECDKIAAEAMIAISLSVEKESFDEFNSLKWLAEVISSECGDDEESIPNGMDYFEFMTLKLEDTKQEHHCPKPFVLKTPSDNEAALKRTRRGQSRRGRQRRDFQRDILPGLVTLSRLEITEDFQAFEELMKAGDSGRFSHRGSTRNGRGKKRLGFATTSPPMKSPCSTEAQKPVCQIEERSLAGWGRKTRRLPRQRCPNAFLSFPVKC